MNLSRRKKAGYTSAVISTVLLGSVGIFVRNIHVDEFIITLCRLCIGLLFVIIYLLITGNLTNISIKRFTLPLISTGVLLGLTMLFYMKAISTISLANSVFLLYLGPIIAAGISFLVYKERFTYLNLILISTAFIGFMFLLQFSFDIADNTGSILGLSAGLCYAFYIVINRRISDAVDSMKRSFYQFFFGFIVLVPFVFTLENVSISLNDIYWLTGISFFQGFLAITFIIIAIKNLKAIEYGTISYVEPLVASLIGYLLYSEQLSMLQIFGCAIILVCGLVQVIMTKNRL